MLFLPGPGVRAGLSIAPTSSAGAVRHPRGRHRAAGRRRGWAAAPGSVRTSALTWPGSPRAPRAGLCLARPRLSCRLLQPVFSQPERQEWRLSCHTFWYIETWGTGWILSYGLGCDPRLDPGGILRRVTFQDADSFHSPSYVARTAGRPAAGLGPDASSSGSNVSFSLC